MARARVSPLGTITQGLLAGAAGTLAMDLVWFRRYRKGGGTHGFVDWEFSAGTKSYEDAASPAQVGKRVVEGVFDTELPPESAALMSNAVHWATGIGWGALYGIVAGSTRSAHPAFGAVLGPAAWASSYVMLGLAKLYKPMWEYDAKTLGRDLGAHAVFGLGTATVFRALLARARR